MRTPFTKPNKEFSDLAHEAAQKLIYPKIFNTSKLSFETTDLADNEHNRILDGEMGIDRVVYVTADFLKMPIKFTIQERFRKPEYYKWQDVTITEWNYNSGLPSELYKINAGMFVYGYYDQVSSVFLDALCVDVPKLLLYIIQKKIKYSYEKNKKNQSFIGLRFTSLAESEVVLWRMGCHGK